MRTGMIIAAVFVLAGFVLRKRLLIHFYLALAAGRSTRLLRFLETALTGKKKRDQETEEHVKWLHAQNMEETEVRSQEGIPLKGYLLRHPRADRIVVMFHGWRGGWDKDCAAFAHDLYEKNCSVLMVSQRAHDQSGGRYIGFGVLERHDCQEWIRFVEEHTERIPIYLSGVSMGASTVLMAAGEKLPRRVKGVIADCGYTSPYEMVKIFAVKFMHMNKKKVENTVDEVNRLCKRKAGYDLREYSTLDAMQNCRIPVFFAHGTEDHFVPYEMSMKNYEACRGKKVLYTAEGASHTKSYVTEPKQYMKAVEEFFQWTPAFQI